MIWMWGAIISVCGNPCAHPQHSKVVKHFVYIWYGCGMQSVLVWSLSHDHRTSIKLNCTTTIFLQSTPTSTSIWVYMWHGCEMQYVLVWSLSHDLAVSLGLCIHMIWMWDAICVSLEPQPWPYSITRAQPYPSFCLESTPTCIQM